MFMERLWRMIRMAFARRLRGEELRREYFANLQRLAEMRDVPAALRAPAGEDERLRAKRALYRRLRKDNLLWDLRRKVDAILSR